MNLQSDRPRLSPRRTGFTLIELLVVVSIIALLIGLLLPALGKAREHSRAGVCMAHMKHLGYALAFYATDNEGYIPREGVYHQRILQRDPLIYERYYHPWPRAFHQYMSERLPYRDKGPEFQASLDTFSNADLDSSLWAQYKYRDMI